MGNTICPLVAGIKCCWQLTTVSPGYLDEMKYDANGREPPSTVKCTRPVASSTALTPNGSGERPHDRPPP
ncbi:MAG: hypothetical protein R2788_22395 [Saprospiraceae bacterium]